MRTPSSWSRPEPGWWARYPKQVFTFDRNNITYFEMNHRKAPFDKLAAPTETGLVELE